MLECLQRDCPSCGSAMPNKYDNYRTVRMLKEVVQLRLKVRRCPKNNNTLAVARAWKNGADSLPSRLTTLAQLPGLTQEIVELLNATIIAVEAAAVLARLVAIAASVETYQDCCSGCGG